MPPNRMWMRAARRLPWLLLAVVVLGPVLVPQGRLACADPHVAVRSPDGAWSLTVCRRPMIFAMPGSGSDAPGWIVLRDREDAIRGVVGLGMLQTYGNSGPAEWSRDRVVVPLTAEMPLRPAPGPVARWWQDRVWRLRALFNLTPTDDDFH